MSGQGMKVEKGTSQFESYALSDGFDGGTVLLREWTQQRKDGISHCGEILFHTSYGSYAYTWISMACRLKQFLSDAARRGERGYIMGKFAGSELMEPDIEATVKRFREEVCRDRRDRRLTKDQARKDWETIDDYEHDSLERLIDAVSETKTFGGDAYEYIEQRMKPAHVHFWESIFVPFCSYLAGEIQAVAA